jgi:hypothetical protein
LRFGLALDTRADDDVLVESRRVGVVLGAAVSAVVATGAVDETAIVVWLVVVASLPQEEAATAMPNRAARSTATEKRARRATAFTSVSPEGRRRLHVHSTRLGVLGQ